MHYVRLNIPQLHLIRHDSSLLWQPYARQEMAGVERIHVDDVTRLQLLRATFSMSCEDIDRTISDGDGEGQPADGQNDQQGWNAIVSNPLLIALEGGSMADEFRMEAAVELSNLRILSPSAVSVVASCLVKVRPDDLPDQVTSASECIARETGVSDAGVKQHLNPDEASHLLLLQQFYRRAAANGQYVLFVPASRPRKAGSQ